MHVFKFNIEHYSLKSTLYVITGIRLFLGHISSVLVCYTKIRQEQPYPVHFELHIRHVSMVFSTDKQTDAGQNTYSSDELNAVVVRTQC